MSDELAKQLADVLGGTITDLARLSGGASRETWAFALDGRPLILQRQRPGAGGSKTGGGMATEADLVRAAAKVGVPVAEVVASGGDDSPLGAPFTVSTRLEGETIPRKLLRDEEWADVRPRLAAQCGRALAAIHSIPLDAVDGLDEPDQVEQFVAILDGYGEPHPAFELAFRWLDQHRPPPTRTAVVHGDFRNGNLIIGPDGLRAVLDWEIAHLGDPMEDLGWLCTRAWRFGAPLPVGGFGTRDDLFAAYEAAGGGPVDPEVVRWWELLGTAKWGVMCIIQSRSHLDGWSRSVELATIGRRVCENEHDVLNLLSDGLWCADGGSATDDARGTEEGAPLHDRPTAGELVEAVREYLENDVMGGTQGRLQFHARVAVNALRIVERELAHPEMLDAHRHRLAAMGFTSDADLAAAIRRGDLDDRWDEIGALIGQSVSDKLAVANPKY